MKKLISTAAKLLLLSIPFTTALANPVIEKIVSGEAKIEQNPDSMIIQQASDKAILNWQSFNINANEKVHFQQPQGGVTLNRINPAQGVSQIYGNLSSNGQLILINGAGVHFGPSAHVDVGSLIVSTTSTITDQNFLKGKYDFDLSLSKQGSIINEGSIKAADYGLVALVGNSVINHGVIEAKLGHVILASNDHFTISFLKGDKFDGLLNFEVKTAAKRSGSGVMNTGTISADGGHVIIAAGAVSTILDNAINLDGVIEANSVAEHNGTIEIIGYNKTDVNVRGKLHASEGTIKINSPGSVTVNNEISVASHNKGGKIDITSYDVFIKQNATLNANGDLGGGEISVGYLPWLFDTGIKTRTFLEAGSTVTADAVVNGKGGTIDIMGVQTKALGTVSAKGGSTKGDGGKVYFTSVDEDLDVANAPDVSAPFGKKGIWIRQIGT